MSFVDNALITPTHSMFLDSVVDITPSSSLLQEWSESVDIPVPFMGDFLYKFYIILDVPIIDNVDSWDHLRLIIFRCLEQISLRINEHQVQSFESSTLWLEWYKHTPEFKLRSQQLTSRDVLCLPIPFWHTRQRTSALPLFQMPSTKIDFCITLKKQPLSGQPLSTLISRIRLFAHYICISREEKSWILSQPPRLEPILSRRELAPITSRWTWNPDIPLNTQRTFPRNIVTATSSYSWFLRSSISVELGDKLPYGIIRDIEWVTMPSEGQGALLTNLPITYARGLNGYLVTLDSVQITLGDDADAIVIDESDRDMARICDTIMTYYKSGNVARVEDISDRDELSLPMAFLYSFSHLPIASDKLYAGALNLRRHCTNSFFIRINYVIHSDPAFLENKVNVPTSLSQLFSPYTWSDELTTHVSMRSYTTIETSKNVQFKHWVEG
jgi:hypothetical protein